MKKNSNPFDGVFGALAAQFGDKSLAATLKTAPKISGAPLSPARQASVKKAAAASAAKRKAQAATKPRSL
jgi:hypothetical protein